MSSLRDVDRYDSPEGRRMLLKYLDTGEWWYAYRLTEAEVRDAEATAERWSEPQVLRSTSSPHRPSWLTVLDGGAEA